MSGNIRISIALLEKLAGEKKEAPPKETPPPGRGPSPSGPIGYGGLPMLPGELRGLLSVEPEVRQALAASRRIGAQLLKAEQEEAERVRAYAAELVQQQCSSPPKTVPCAAEREAFLACHREHPQDFLACAKLVAAFSACSQAAMEVWSKT